MLSIAIPPPTGVTLTPTTSSIMVSWTAPQFITPDSYNVSIICTRFCDNIQISDVQSVPNGGATNHTITSVNPGNNCTVKVTAVVGSTSSESAGVTTVTPTEGMYSCYCKIMFIVTACLLSP